VVYETFKNRRIEDQSFKSAPRQQWVGIAMPSFA